MKCDRVDRRDEVAVNHMTLLGEMIDHNLEMLANENEVFQGL
jgi:hypothetical protein